VSEYVRLHLLAMRAMLDALIAQMGHQPLPPPADTATVGSCPRCGATEDKTADASTMGGARTTRCLLCGAEWESQT
jgi:formate dehydrogenase maturation protein FdhE